jgi:hypothetical protein
MQKKEETVPVLHSGIGSKDSKDGPLLLVLSFPNWRNIHTP